MSLERHDVLVIGGGAAGRSAALVLGRARRRVAVIDAAKPSNAVSSGIGGFLGQDQRDPDEFYKETAEELAKYPTISWSNGTVVGLQRGEDGWEATLDDGRGLVATHVLLAMGMRYDVPDIPGIEPLWGASVFHCPFCHGWEHRDQPLLALAGGPGTSRALLLRNWTSDVTVIAPPGSLTGADRDLVVAAGVPVVDGEVARLRGQGRELEAAEMADGTVVPARGMLIAAPHVQRSDLAERLGVEADDSGHLVVDEMARTNVDGVWAVGDLTSPMASVARAVATGSMAAAGIVHDMTFGRPSHG